MLIHPDPAVNKSINRLIKLSQSKKLYILKCSWCNGSGRFFNQPCPICKGKGFEIRIFKPSCIKRDTWWKNLIASLPRTTENENWLDKTVSLKQLYKELKAKKIPYKEV